MCGIYLALSRKGPLPPSKKILEYLANRGPDSLREVSYEINIESSKEKADDDGFKSDHENHFADKVFLSCASSVLSLRGNSTVCQPVTSNVVQEHQSVPCLLCWNGEAWTFAGSPIQGNDSEHVLRLLSHVSSAATSHQNLQAHAVAEALASYAGPHAFAFYDACHKRLYFGRDLLGRRSLLFRRTADGDFVLSSVPDVSSSDWVEVEADGIYYIDLASMMRQEATTPAKVPYCFGTVDALPHKTVSIRELRLNKEVPDNYISSVLPLCPSVSSTDTAHRLLKSSLMRRVCDIPRLNVRINGETALKPAKVAVLFSGGLDCTLLARIGHDMIDPTEPIDLLNVAFENPRVHRNQQQSDTGTTSPYELCPDRVTGRLSCEELQLSCPGREWRFVAIDIPYTETVAHRSTVMNLMHPHNTEMDLSIACALYFASRGAGTVVDLYGTVTSYTTAARVLISGLGADELFGGYTRHSTAYNRGGFSGLADELELDVGRLGKRNLGRDDRVLSNWAHEARFPFLDEEFVNWSLQLPVWEKCGFGQSLESPLDPTKQLLRKLAVKLGMPRVANEKKRAIQFGARTAKMEAGRSKGTDILVLAE